VFANQTAIAIHNARQVEVQMAKQAFEHELIHAGKVQQGLLLNHIPTIGRIKITALNIPSKIVSGDLYDVAKLDDNSLGIAIGDVSGKGAPAALMMALILAGLRAQNKNYRTTCDLFTG
jgi:serine phosphatase RsbU (regulator of sigma subunit)